MRRRRELGALSAAGFSRMTLLAPLFIIAAAATVLIYFTQEGVLTARGAAMTSHRTRLRLAKRQDTAGLITWKGATLLYRSVSAAGTFEDVVLARFDDSNRIEELSFAKRAVLKKDTWLIEDANPAGSSQLKKSRTLDAPEKMRGISKVRTYTFPALSELLDSVRRGAGSRQRTAFWSRLAYPLLHWVILVFGAGLFLGGESESAARRVVFAFLGTVMVFFAHMLILTLASNGFLPAAIGALFVPVAATGWGWWLITNSRGA
jgi:lipopolysaccharide export LptBFGC system permease protein LptF